MNFWSVLGIALALSMDAFAVAVATGVCARAPLACAAKARMAAAFGFFQFLMPLLGWAAGVSVRAWIDGCDHWIAFILLAAVGGNMIYGSFQKEGECSAQKDPTRGWRLFVLAVATSIDALAVGLSFALLKIAPWAPSAVIGAVCAALTLSGLRLGRTLGAARLIAKRAELLGGLVLFGIGIKILADHGAL